MTTVKNNDDSYSVGITEDDTVTEEYAGTLEDITSEDSELVDYVLEQLGIENPSEELKDDISAFIKIHAKKINDDTTVSEFVNDVITSLREVADDSELTEDELETGIIQQSKEVLASESTEFSSKEDNSLYDFLADVLLSISNGGNLEAEDAKLLSELLGIEEDLATQIIEMTDGDITSVLELVASSEDYTDDTNDDFANNDLSEEDLVNFQTDVTVDALKEKEKQ